MKLHLHVQNMLETDVTPFSGALPSPKVTSSSAVLSLLCPGFARAPRADPDREASFEAGLYAARASSDD